MAFLEGILGFELAHLAAHTLNVLRHVPELAVGHVLFELLTGARDAHGRDDLTQTGVQLGHPVGEALAVVRIAAEMHLVDHHAAGKQGLQLQVPAQGIDHPAAVTRVHAYAQAEVAQACRRRRRIQHALHVAAGVAALDGVLQAQVAVAIEVDLAAVFSEAGRVHADAGQVARFWAALSQGGRLELRAGHERVAVAPLRGNAQRAVQEAALRDPPLAGRKGASVRGSYLPGGLEAVAARVRSVYGVRAELLMVEQPGVEGLAAGASGHDLAPMDDVGKVQQAQSVGLHARLGLHALELAGAGLGIRHQHPELDAVAGELALHA